MEVIRHLRKRNVVILIEDIGDDTYCSLGIPNLGIPNTAHWLPPDIIMIWIPGTPFYLPPEMTIWDSDFNYKLAPKNWFMI